jgi:hypothetical protein
LGNTPLPESILAPEILPARWPSLKQRVVLPFLIDAANSSHFEPTETLAHRLEEWAKNP